MGNTVKKRKVENGPSRRRKLGMGQKGEESLELAIKKKKVDNGPSRRRKLGMGHKGEQKSAMAIKEKTVWKIP